MTIIDKITLLQLAYEGFFSQRNEAKRGAADAISALALEIESYVLEKVQPNDRVYCDSIIRGVQAYLEAHFKDPAAAKRDAGLEELLAKLIRISFL